MSADFFNGPLVKTRRGDVGENGILFRAYLDCWAEKNGKSYPNAREAINITFDEDRPGFFKGNPPEQTEHFSIDNMTGLYAMCKMHAPERMEELPIINWNHKPEPGTEAWWHPNGWMVFMGMKWDIFKFIFHVPYLIMCIWSAMRPVEDTSGRNLWWLRSEMLEKPSMQKWMKRLGRKTGGFTKVEHGFKYYFTHRFEWTENYDHIILREIDDYNFFVKDL